MQGVCPLCILTGCGCVCNVPIACRVCAGCGVGKCDSSLERVRAET